MTAETVLLIGVPAIVAAALAEAGIHTAEAIAPGEAAAAVIGAARPELIALLRAEAPDLPVITLDGGRQADDTAPPEAAVAAVQPWLISGMVAALERLAGMFGREPMVGLATGLAALVGEPDPDAVRAHRIAGLAGTLGLSALNAPWLAVSEGDWTRLPSALRAASRARAAIALFAAG